jgi:aminotransferase
MDVSSLLADRTRAIDASGIRRVFDLGAKLKDPINLSIGQPDFPVPEPIKQAAVRAIHANSNGYTVTQGIEPLRKRIAEHLRFDLGWEVDIRTRAEGANGSPFVTITSGTSGAIALAFMALLNPGDEVIIPDPYFVMYPHMATMCGAKAVKCDTYPDFRMTAARIEPLITPRTKAVILCSPSNPAGVVASAAECKAVAELCRDRNLILISDEIYDAFTYEDAREPTASDPTPRCPSPARGLKNSSEFVLLVRGFGKSYGLTGWRLGYAAGPRVLIEEMNKLQQYTYVCAPSPLQWGVLAALDYDISPMVRAYQKRRDMVVERLSRVTELATPGGAFYAFPRVPERLGMTAAEFVNKCIEKSLLVIPGGVFSSKDTHFRLSWATDERNLARGLDVLVDLLQG